MKDNLPRLLTFVCLALGVQAAASPAWAGRGCAHCGAPCAPAAPQMVEKTVLCPETVYVKKTVKVTEYTPEVRERTCTVMVPQPKTMTVKKTCLVMVPKMQTRTVTRRVCRPVTEEVEETCTYCVPQQVTKRGVRQVVECVPTTKTRTVCVDEGCWQTVPGDCNSACGGCGSCAPVCRRVWVPKVVKKEVQYTSYDRVVKEEPYECQVTVMKPVTKTIKVQRCRPQWDVVTEQVECMVLVPKHVTRDVEICTWDCVPVEKTVPCTVMVPHEVEREIVVPVCRMVKKTIQVPACSPACCNDCL